MKIAVIGLWHLGCVTAACLAKSGYEVLAFDPDTKLIAKLQLGSTPIFEPGLDDLLIAGKEAGQLHFSSDPKCLTEAEVAWITFDTPVDENDNADVEWVTNEIKTILPYLKDNILLLISSQIPVGTTRKLEQFCTEAYPNKPIRFAVIPENLRLGKAISAFMQPERIVIGYRDEADKNQIQSLLQPFTHHLIWMSIESAEMTKHALNAFLATSVIFINELAMLCERVGANAREVERGLKSEERIGPKAYLRPGDAIAGGTLARDVNYLIQLGQQQKLPTSLFTALLQSNESHKQWAQRKVLQILKNLQGKTITLLGLTYKVDTDTLRRSQAIEIGSWLKQQGAKVMAYDPIVAHLPDNLANFIELKPTLLKALKDAEAVIVTTECSQLTLLTPELLLSQVKEPHVLDASGFLLNKLSHDKRIRYYSVGIPT